MTARLVRNHHAVIRRLERSGLPVAFVVDAPRRRAGLLTTRVSAAQGPLFSILDVLSGPRHRPDLELSPNEMASLHEIGVLVEEDDQAAEVRFAPGLSQDDCEATDHGGTRFAGLDTRVASVSVRHLRTGAIWPARGVSRAVAGPGQHVLRQKRWSLGTRVAAAQEAFRSKGLAELRGIVPEHAMTALQCYYRRLREEGYLTLGDSQSRRWVRHNEPLQRALQEELLAYIASIVGVPVVPSYTYLGVYEPGADLPRHTDRAQCGYTLSLTIDAASVRNAEGAWPLFVELPEGPRAIRMLEGDGVVFRGVDLPHWRPPLETEAPWTVLFFHYVDPNFKGALA